MSPQASIFFLPLLNRFTFTYDAMSGRLFLSYLYLPSLLSAYLFDSIVVPSPPPQNLCLPWLFIFLRVPYDIIYLHPVSVQSCPGGDFANQSFVLLR